MPVLLAFLKWAVYLSLILIDTIAYPETPAIGSCIFAYDVHTVLAIIDAIGNLIISASTHVKQVFWVLLSDLVKAFIVFGRVVYEVVMFNRYMLTVRAIGDKLAAIHLIGEHIVGLWILSRQCILVDIIGDWMNVVA